MGTGHVMRMIALAQAWQMAGGQARFIGSISEKVARRVEAAGFPVNQLPDPHPDPRDLERTQEAADSFDGPGPLWVAVDGYHFTPNYMAALQRVGAKTLLVDDLVHYETYPVDILVNQNIHAPQISYEAPPSTIQLLGINYTMLREEFLAVDRSKKPPSKPFRNLLVTLGGGDPDGVSLKVLSAIQEEMEHPLQVRLVVGGASPHADEIRAIAKQTKSVKVYIDTDEMPALMGWADLAISAGGSTCWELCYMGVPPLIIPIADNQELIARALAEMEVGWNLGWHASIGTSDVAAAIDKALSTPDELVKRAARGQRLVDGLGAQRIVRCMRGERIVLREVQPEDRALLWDWANDPAVREAAFSTGPIPWDDHCAWFKERLGDSETYIYIGNSLDGNPLGQIRFEPGREAHVAEVDVSIGRRWRGHGFGTELIQSGVQRLLSTTNYERVDALVQPSNEGSQRAFQAAGFHQEGVVERDGYKAILFTRRSLE